MFVAPSTVLYTTCPGAPGLEALASDAELEELSRKLLANAEGLRLQVVEKDGHYFTLNNTRLQVCQWLETRGHCSTVRIETVPLKSVPEGIKRMMVVPTTAAMPVPVPESMMTITYEPMERRPRAANDDNDDQSGSDDDDGLDSDSSFDEYEAREQHRRRRQSEESGEEEDASLL